ncbi:DEAD/DEAH box helicase family protein [Bacillus sp. Marseille-P3661]|uniref:DEAD/DEAH box helicase family protein n=1 Tax=Bacillus sp. Marseille-P3661 TaxID=1936234 RepID=UPI000C8610B0|nr:DEAD/DEAH box helicase family protein [Bacillus sp. Marseille-P3661]
MYKDLNISYHYESGLEQNIVRDFYLPILSNTSIYKRLIGHFSIETLILAAKGVVEIIDNNSTFQLISSVKFSPQELEILQVSESSREEIIENVLKKTLSNPSDSFQKARIGALATLLDNNQLEIRLLIPKDYSFLGIHYEQIGIMEDFEGEQIAFVNQINETKGEYQSNYEIMDVFFSWNTQDRIRVENKYGHFQKLWTGEHNLYETINLPESIKNIIISYKEENVNLIEPEVGNNSSTFNINIFPKIPLYIQIREYQQEAIRNWFRNNCQGLLEMATGTGKTITALTATAKLWEVTKRLGVVIVCPYTHLVDQWVKDIKQFNMSPIIAYQSKRLWEDALYNEVTAFQSGITNHFCLVTTIATFTTESMQSILRKLNSDVLFIADEAHHLGARKNRKRLIHTFPYRLALSATPNRWHDEEGTNELIEYFGDSIVFQYGLDKAIGTFLTEYYYFPHIVYLDEDESEYYYEITKKIARMYFQDMSPDENESLQSLLIERSRILSRARNKLVILKELMKDRKDSKYNIIYCGDSQVDGEKQIDSVVNILGNEFNMNVHTFTSREDKEERKVLLKRFEDGDLQALVAIKCLDEGVDVPATQTAYILSSSTNPREFIQRRGRVLRKHKTKQFSYIHDFIVVPRQLEDLDLVEPTVFNIERNLIKRELSRFSEFADLAINGPLAHEKLNELKQAYHLLNV